MEAYILQFAIIAVMACSVCIANLTKGVNGSNWMYMAYLCAAIRRRIVIIMILAYSGDAFGGGLIYV